MFKIGNIDMISEIARRKNLAKKAPMIGKKKKGSLRNI